MRPSGGQGLAGAYLADAVYGGHQAVLSQVWVAPSSTEGGMHPCGEVKDQLLSLGVHAHIPGWGCRGAGQRVSCERPRLQEVTGAGLQLTGKSGQGYSLAWSWWGEVKCWEGLPARVTY